ncbi:hypothetical protein BGZ63DRAFT_434223 [Mariannaea sp. PMI_226]|nr:hypothetical protein BGZ63DRAFT_434223 [Mariannaea sp. PMI_226]
MSMASSIGITSARRVSLLILAWFSPAILISLELSRQYSIRGTVTGTLQWMTPELFNLFVLYVIEVDIWAFGSMTYEVATVSPLDATNMVDLAHLGSNLNKIPPSRVLRGSVLV